MSESTEAAAPRYQGMDCWGLDDLLKALWGGQMQALAACLPALPALAKAVAEAAERLKSGRGRLVYAGAGSSGMVAALDALDLADTFDWPDDRLLILLAGGLDLRGGLAAEREDDADLGRSWVRAHGIQAWDVVIGVSASGRSAFTNAIVEEARALGALTIGLAAMPASPLVLAAEHPIAVATGAEVLAGSTRLGAGTAHKVVLNLFSTAVMTGLGKVYDNLMIDVRAANAKQKQRRIAIVAKVSGASAADAEAALARHGNVKEAVLALAGVPDADISALLTRAAGNLRTALAAAHRAGGR